MIYQLCRKFKLAYRQANLKLLVAWKLHEIQYSAIEILDYYADFVQC